MMKTARYRNFYFGTFIILQRWGSWGTHSWALTTAWCAA